MTHQAIINKVCHERNIKLIDVKTMTEQEVSEFVHNTTGRSDDLIDSSWKVGKEIILGVYTDDDRRLASFFHELGHELMHKEYNYKDTFPVLFWELGCWSCGFHYAYRRFRIIFKEETIKWALERALTYFYYK